MPHDACYATAAATDADCYRHFPRRDSPVDIAYRAALMLRLIRFRAFAARR